MLCGFGNHQLKDPTTITSASVLKLVRSRFPDFRQQTEVCARCRNSVIFMMYKRRNLIKAKLANSSDKVSSINSPLSDSFDRLVNSSPKNFALQIPSDTPVQQTTHTISSSGDGSSSSFSMDIAQLGDSQLILSRNSLTVDRSESEETPLKHKNAGATSGSGKRKRVHYETSRASGDVDVTPTGSRIGKSKQGANATESNYERPSNSKENSTEHRYSTRRSSIQNDPLATNNLQTDSEDDIPLTAINVARGVRFPDIQPAPKRRPFTHTNPGVMDIYIRGLLGG